MRRYLPCSTVVVAVVLGGSGCGSPAVKLMPTPLVYTQAVDPYARLEPDRQVAQLPVFYATNRKGKTDAQGVSKYGNGITDTLSLGVGVVSFDNLAWDELWAASTSAERRDITLKLDGVTELAEVKAESAFPERAQAARFVDAVNRAIAKAPDPEVLVFVHGAKVNFYNGVVHTAELTHFAGRDMVPVAFCWPTRQDIVAYVIGTDTGRARASIPRLETLIRLLAETDAERINLVAWSAGPRVLGRALATLRDAEPGLDHAALQEKYRVGSVVFAAGDVPIKEFAGWLPSIHDIAEQVVVTTSDGDGALAMSRLTMLGGQRIGLVRGRERTETEEKFVRSLDRLEIVNVSGLADERGFDIGGHDYWFTNPWVSSDLMVIMRTGLPAGQRGLVEGDRSRVWYLPADYPDRLAALVAGLRAAAGRGGAQYVPAPASQASE